MRDDQGVAAKTPDLWIRVSVCVLCAILCGGVWTQQTTEMARRSKIDRFSRELGIDEHHPLSSEKARLAFRGDLAANIAAETMFRDWYSAQLRCRGSKGSPEFWNDHRGVLSPLWRYPPPFPSAAGDYASEFLESKRQLEASISGASSSVNSLPPNHGLQRAMSLAATAALQNPGFLDYRLTVFKLRFALDGSLPRDSQDWRAFGDRTGLLIRLAQSGERCAD